LRPENVWVPYYVCDAVIEAVKKAGIGIKRYSIASNFSPQAYVEIGVNDVIILIDYLWAMCAKS